MDDKAHVLPCGRWQECLGNLPEATLWVEPGSWFHDPSGPDALHMPEVSSAADELALVISSWPNKDLCGAAEANCVHKTRSVVVAIGLWLAIMSRNGGALERLLKMHDTIEQANVMCTHYARKHSKPKTSSASNSDSDDDDTVGSRLGNAARGARAIVKEATGVKSHTFLRYQIKHVIMVCFGRIPGEAHITLGSDIALDEPGPSELALTRVGADVLDPLALVVADILCEKRYAKCLPEIRQRQAVCGIALSVLQEGARPDLLDMERVLVACDSLWHLDEGVGLTAFFIEPPEDVSDTEKRADCVLLAQKFAALASMPVGRANVCHAFVHHRMSLGPTGTVQLANTIMRNPPPILSDIRARLTHRQRQRRHITSRRAQAFCSLGRDVVDCVTAGIWHAAQVPERGDEAMLRAAMERHASMEDAQNAASWPFIVDALTARGPGAVDAAKDMIRHMSRWLASLVLEALSMDPIWRNVYTVKEPPAPGEENKNKDDKEDIPPLTALVDLVHAHPDIALDPVHANAMARILASLRACCLYFDDESSSSSSSSSSDTDDGESQSGDSDDGDSVNTNIHDDATKSINDSNANSDKNTNNSDDSDDSDDDDDKVQEIERPKSWNKDAFLVKDGSSRLLFDAPAWMAAAECILRETRKGCTTTWEREVWFETRTADARAFAASVCRAHDQGTLVIEPASLKEALLGFAVGVVEPDQLVLENPRISICIATLCDY